MIGRWWRAWSSAWLAVGLACGPAAPDETTGSSGSAGSTGSTTTASVTDAGTSSSSGTGTTETTAGTTAASSGGGSTTEPAECVIDPSQDLCSEGCDWYTDCCLCEGATLTPADATDCVISTGIVAAVCPWWVLGIRLDGEPLQEGGCGGPDMAWTQYEKDGERVVELCGKACKTYLAGDFAELRIEMFCEVA